MSAEQIAEDLLSKPAEFDALAHFKGASHAKGTVDVFMDGEAAYDLTLLQHELAKAEAHLQNLAAGYNGGITHSEGYDEAEAEVEELKAKEQAAAEKAVRGLTTFHLRGVPPKLWRIIYKKAMHEVPPPARKNYASDEDGEQAFERDTLLRTQERASLMTLMEVASAIVKVVDFDGNEDTHTWTAEQAEVLQDGLYDSEWAKIVHKQRELTNGNGLFVAAAERSADFLSRR